MWVLGEREIGPGWTAGSRVGCSQAQSVEVSGESLLGVRHWGAVSLMLWKMEAPSPGGSAPTTRDVGPAFADISIRHQEPEILWLNRNSPKFKISVTKEI